jgi:hypothetical protein
MEVSGQPHTPVALPAGLETPVKGKGKVKGKIVPVL